MQTLDKDFRALTRAAFARYGFAYADLLTQWPAIVGDNVAQWSEPERIKWPRTGADERKQGGTLVIRVTPGRGLDLQHETPRIIDRINAFYGYPAVGAVKIRQGPLSRKKAQTQALHPPITARPRPSKASSKGSLIPCSKRRSGGWDKGC